MILPPPTPRTLADAWLADLRALPRTVLPISPPAEALRLLALPARLRRCQPELIDAPDVPPLLARADQEAPTLAPAAPAAFEEDDWLRDAQTLADSWNEPPPAVEAEAVAVRLLGSLDDADLARRQARRSGFADAAWDSATAACLAWLDTHADCLLPATPWATAMTGTFRPDLEEAVPDLAPTAVPFRRLLDEAAAAEKEIGYAARPVLPAVRASLQRRGAGRQRWRSFEAARLLRPRPAAAAGAEPGPPLVLTWASPDGQFEALAALPSGSAIETVRLNVYDTEGRRATELAGYLVRLAAVSGRLDAEGGVEFSLTALAATGRDLLLEVGPTLTVWDALDPGED